MQRKRRVAFAIWVTLWAIIVIAALALIHHCRRLVRDSMTDEAEIPSPGSLSELLRARKRRSPRSPSLHRSSLTASAAIFRQPSAWRGVRFVMFVLQFPPRFRCGLGLERSTRGPGGMAVNDIPPPPVGAGPPPHREQLLFLSPPPILLRLPTNRWRRRVLEFERVRRSARSVARV